MNFNLEQKLCCPYQYHISKNISTYSTTRIRNSSSVTKNPAHEHNSRRTDADADAYDDADADAEQMSR